MKKKLLALLTLTLLLVQPTMAIPDEETLDYYLFDTYFFRPIAGESNEDQSVSVYYDRFGKVFDRNDTVMVIQRFAEPSGSCYIYELSQAMTQYKDSVTYIIIKSGANDIRLHWNAFKDFKKLQAVYAYVDTISEFGQDAFWGCSRLTTIEGKKGKFPKCKDIWKGAFVGCAFTSIDLSNSDSICFGRGVFANCASLQRFVFPSKAGLLNGKEGLNGMFSGCRALDSLVLPDYLNVGATENMFKNCESLKELAVPDGFWWLRDGFLSGCTNLKKLTIPSSVEMYEDGLLNDCKALDTIVFAGQILQPHTFDSCPNLHVLTLLNGVDSIADFAFSGLRNIQTLQLPQSLRAITGGAFVGSTGIDTVWCANNNYRVYSDGALYKGFWNELVYMPQAQTPSRLTLHNLTKHIGPYAFCNNSHLDTVMLHYDVESIGDSAFAGCTNVKKLYLPNMQTTVGEHAFDGIQEVQWSNLNYPNGWCNYDFIWSIDSIGIFTLQGQGDILYQSWETHRESIQYVIWPKGITLPDHFMKGYTTIQCAVLPMKLAEKPDGAFHNSARYLLFDDAFSVGGYNALFTLLQPVDVEIEGNMEITPMIDSLLVRWKAPGAEPENLYRYRFCQGNSQIGTLAFNSEAFHNRMMDSIRVGANINTMRNALEYGVQECNDGGAPDNYEPKVYEMIVPDIPQGLYWYKLISSCGWSGMDEPVPVAVYKVDSMATENTTFRVRFYKAGMSATNLISEQQVPYRQAAVEPEDPVPAEDYQYFAGWDKDFSYITKDLDVFAVYMSKNSLPEQLELTKDESKIKDGIIKLTFKWTWPGTPFNSVTEWQLFENNEIISSAYAPLHLNPIYGTHTEQLTASQFGYGEHTLSWRVRTVGEDYHDAWSVWVNGEDIQFLFSGESAIEDIHIEGAQPAKVFHDGQIYILLSGKTYTLQGQEVKKLPKNDKKSER